MEEEVYEVPRPPEKKVIDKVVLSVKERPKRPIKTNIKREPKHPGKNKLKELIIEHQANISKIANDLRVNNSTISRWINEDPKLKQLAQKQRRARVEEKRESFKALIIEHQANSYKIAKDLRVSNRTISRWINKDPKLKQLAQEQRKARVSEKQRKAREKEKQRTARAEERHERLKALIIEHQGKMSKVADDLRVSNSTISRWINKDPKLKQLAQEQRKARVSEKQRRTRASRGGRAKKVKPSSNPGKKILEALIFNYEGDLEAMAKNPNINTDVETLRSWIKEEGIESLVKE